jgi:hypothetical protein
LEDREGFLGNGHKTEVENAVVEEEAGGALMKEGDELSAMV